MKILIWFSVLLCNSIIVMIIKDNGIFTTTAQSDNEIILNAILIGLVYACLYGGAIWWASFLCKKWDKHKQIKKGIDIPSANLPKAPVAPVTRKELLHETVKYIIAGGCTTLFNLVVYRLLYHGLAVEVNLSNFISIVLAILFAYGINKLYVFRSRCNGAKELAAEFAKFVGARLLTMLLEVGGVFLLYSILHLDEMVSKLVTQVFVLISNYFISKLLVFKKKTR